MATRKDAVIAVMTEHGTVMALKIRSRILNKHVSSIIKIPNKACSQKYRYKE